MHNSSEARIREALSALVSPAQQDSASDEQLSPAAEAAAAAAAAGIFRPSSIRVSHSIDIFASKWRTWGICRTEISIFWFAMVTVDPKLSVVIQRAISHPLIWWKLSAINQRAVAHAPVGGFIAQAGLMCFANLCSNQGLIFTRLSERQSRFTAACPERSNHPAHISDCRAELPDVAARCSHGHVD